MTFPLYYFLFPYILFLAIWLIFSLVSIYHMVSFGFFNFTTFLTTFIFIGVSVLLLKYSYDFLSPIDWGYNVSLFGNMFSNQTIF
jgi:hypothetical protein